MFVSQPHLSPNPADYEPFQIEPYFVDLVKLFLREEYSSYFIHASNDSEIIANPVHDMEFLHYVTTAFDQQFCNSVVYVTYKEPQPYALLRQFMSAWSSGNIAFH